MKLLLQYSLLIVILPGLLSCSSEDRGDARVFSATDTTHNLQVSSGKIDRYYTESQFIDGRNVDIWLPENYSPDKQHSVLYMHDGQMLFDSTKTWNKQEWQVDEIAGDLIKKNQIIDLIVVGIWNNNNQRYAEYFPQKAIENISPAKRDSLMELFPGKPQADQYLQFLVKELKPFVDQNYATYTDKQHTFLMGSSMGGLISIYAVSEYPEVFGGAACLSTHWIGSFESNDTIANAINSYLDKNLPDPTDHKIYFDHGTETLDAHYPPYQDLIDQTMKKNGYTVGNWMSREFSGADHSEHSWSQRLHIPLTFLFGK